MRVGSGLSTDPDARVGAAQAATAARVGLGGEPAGLAVVFASRHHAPSAAAMVEAVHEVVEPDGLIGCVAEAVIGGRREVEDEPAISVWLASLPSQLDTFHMEFVWTSSGGAFAGWLFDLGSEGETHLHPVYLLIADPFTFPADLLLRHLNESAPGTLVMGGMAGGGRGPGETVLFHDRSIRRSGAVGVRLPDSAVATTLVSQGCRPIGHPFVVTKAEENVVYELAGRPAFERLQEVVAALSPVERELVSHGLHVGRVIDEYKSEHGVGDFLIRGVIGVDPDTGGIAVGDHLDMGQTVRFHVRDAATADEELRSMLGRDLGALSGPAAGALLFTCNGRGTPLFGIPDHDASLVSEHTGGAPMAGFFCAGELGPVGGKNFLHGFTASLLVLRSDR